VEKEGCEMNASQDEEKPGRDGLQRRDVPWQEVDYKEGNEKNEDEKSPD
jgi:hypothetical protein